MDLKNILDYINYCRVNNIKADDPKSANKYIRVHYEKEYPNGFHYIVLNKLIYRLDNETYLQLNELRTKYEKADMEFKEAYAKDESADPDEAMYHANNFWNFKDWIEYKSFNASLSIEDDNLDLHLYRK